MARKKRISQMDIARASGVSQTLVSAIFNNAPGIAVSTDTRQRVLSIADQLGYARRFTPLDAWGRSCTKTFAWIRIHKNSIDDRNPGVVVSAYDGFVQQLFSSALQQLDEEDYSLVVRNYSPEDSLEQWLEHQRAQGVFWSGNTAESPEFADIAKKYPLVVLNRSMIPDVDRTAVNEPENVSLPIEHLIAKGHRRIAYFGHVSTSEVFNTRKHAYERIMTERGLRVYREFFAIDDSIDIPSRQKAQQIFALCKNLGGERPTAIILNDFHALHLIQQAREHGIRIPEDLSVMGIDNVSYDDLSVPRLTSMRQPFDEMGRIAVELILSRLEDPDRLPRLMMVSPQLIERDSVAPPRG